MAGFVASTAATEELCKGLDPHYTLSVTEVVGAFNQEVLPGDRIPSPAPSTLSQQKLSRALGAATIEELNKPGPGQEAYRAHLQMLQQPGAGAWLRAPPAENLGLHVAPALFRLMVCLRLRLPVASEDVACPLCDGIADCMGDHARACPCGGDRTKRHHRLRSVLAARAQAGGLNPVVEKAGLLPPRLDSGGAPEDGVQVGGGRRPADVWVGSWGAHGPAAFDLAVTSGLRQGLWLPQQQQGPALQKPASGPICRQRPLVLMKGYNSSPWSQRLPAEAGPLWPCKPGGSLRIASQPALANSLKSSSKSCSAFSARTRELSCGVRAGLMPAPRPWRTHEDMPGRPWSEQVEL